MGSTWSSGYPDFRPIIEVQGVAVRDDGIQGVIAPGQLQDDQHSVFLVFDAIGALPPP